MKTRKRKRTTRLRAWEPDDDYGPMPEYEDKPEAWERQAEIIERRQGPRCPALYEEAVKLTEDSQGPKTTGSQKRIWARQSRGVDVEPRKIQHCRAVDLERAMQAAFTGPCKRAAKVLKKAKVNCRISKPSKLIPSDYMQRKIAEEEKVYGHAYTKYLRERGMFGFGKVSVRR